MPEEDVIPNHCMWTDFVSVAVSVVAIAGVAGIVSADEADATKEHNRKLIERRLDPPRPETDDSKLEEFRLQKLRRLQLQTDQAMEQSSRALRELTKEGGKQD